MQSVCRAERGSTASETSELPQCQPVVVERNARSQVKETANVAMVAGVAIALSAMLAVPGPADAAEAVSLDFLTKFLASVYATIPTCFAVIYVSLHAGMPDCKADVAATECRTRYNNWALGGQHFSLLPSYVPR